MLPLAEIAKLGALKDAEINEAKKILATEATALVHGREAALAAAETARRTFEEGAIAEDLPSVDVARAELEAGLGVLIAFVKAGLVASNGEARRQIKSGGLRVNDQPVTDEKMTLTSSQLTSEGVIKLSMGRKRHVLLRPLNCPVAHVRLLRREICRAGSRLAARVEVEDLAQHARRHGRDRIDAQASASPACRPPRR